jgi:hypothetical protein
VPAEVTVTDESPDVDAVDGTLDGEAENEAEAARPTRSEAMDELWEEVGIEPVKVALPRETVGFTLRAYRPESQLTPTEVAAAEEDEDDPFAERDRARAAEDAEYEADLEAMAMAGAGDRDEDEDEDEDDELTDEQLDEALEQELAAGEEERGEDVPIFLSRRGKLLLFATAESLATFIGASSEHDLAQLDTWEALSKRVRADDIIPTDEDTYELDLVVENLRGGHDVWDLTLLISAGEFARDIGYALRLEPVVTALAPGSPLDDLDEALRAAAAGGIGGAFARRRLRRIGAQQASLGWRTIIGKISGAVDWRD